MFRPTSAVRPGCSSGFSPIKPSHQNVRESPSNETVASATTTKTTLAADNEPTQNNRAPGIVTASLRPPSSPATARSGAIQLTIRKNREKISTLRVHAASPNRTIPATVKTEYPATATARIAGSRGAGKTSSNHAKSSSRTTAGQAPSASGQASNPSSSSVVRRRIRRARRANAVQGLRCGHTSPSTACTKVSPTQSSVHTASGRGFTRGSRLPARPATTRATSTTDAAAFDAGTCSISGNSRHRVDSMARRSAAPRIRMTTRNDTATANVPAAWKSPVGSSRMKPRSPACARTGGAAPAASAPSVIAAVTRFTVSTSDGR